MTTQAPAKTRRRTPKTPDLPADLLEQVDAARGDTPREEWIAATLTERLDRDRQSAEPVADLDETPARATIRFRKQLYELRNIAEFGPIEQHGLQRDGQEFSEIWSSSEELSHEDARGQRLLMLIERLFDRVLDAPAEIKDRFTDGQKAQVILSFTYAPARQLAQLAQLLEHLNQPGNESA